MSGQATPKPRTKEVYLDAKEDHAFSFLGPVWCFGGRPPKDRCASTMVKGKQIKVGGLYSAHVDRLRLRLNNYRYACAWNDFIEGPKFNISYPKDLMGNIFTGL